jgi:tRNA modification GTPase
VAFARERGLAVREAAVACGSAAGVLAWLEADVLAELGSTEFPAATQSRHRESLGQAGSHVRRALRSLDRPELAVEDVRMASRALQRVTGGIGAEDVLDKGFT